MSQGVFAILNSYALLKQYEKIQKEIKRTITKKLENREPLRTLCAYTVLLIDEIDKKEKEEKEEREIKIAEREKRMRKKEVNSNE